MQRTACPRLLPVALLIVPLITAASSRLAVPCTRRRATEWVFDSTPPPAHIAKRTVAATEVLPLGTVSLDGVPDAGARHPTAAPARAPVAPSATEHAMSAILRIKLEQVPAGHGWRATHERRERIRRGNRRGAECWSLCGQTMPQPGAAPSPML